MFYGILAKFFGVLFILEVTARSGQRGRWLVMDDEEEEMVVVVSEDDGGCGRARLEKARQKSKKMK